MVIEPPPSSSFKASIFVPPPAFWPEGVAHNFLLPTVLSESVSCILIGVLFTQIIYYLRRYRKDPLWIRIVVWSLLLLNILHCAFEISRAVVVFAIGFGDWRALDDFHDRFQELSNPSISVIIITLCQGTLAVRSYFFSRSLANGEGSRMSWTVILTSVIKVSLILASFAFGLGANIYEASYSNLFGLKADNGLRFVGRTPYTLFQTMWLILGAAADIAIAACMWNDARRARTGFQTASDSVLKVLIAVSLRCGFILALAQGLLLILYFAVAAMWADAAHSVLPRIASLTVLYSITSPREAYRAIVRQEELDVAAAGASPVRNSNDRESSYTSESTVGTPHGIGRLTSLRGSSTAGRGTSGSNPTTRTTGARKTPIVRSLGSRKAGETLSQEVDGRGELVRVDTGDGTAGDWEEVCKGDVKETKESLGG